MEQELLNIQGLTVDYGKRRAISDISFKLSEGETVGIVGESGCGKSTILRACMGMLNKNASLVNGNVYFNGQDMFSLREDELLKIRGEKIGMIFQNCKDSFCPVRTIKAQLYEYVSQHRRVSRKEVYSASKELLEKLNFRDVDRILDSYSFELSGGMNQRLGIIMALLLKPKLILADEPTASLDVTSQLRVLSELKEFKREYNTSLLLVSHNIGVVSYMADRIIVMKGGKIAEMGKREQILNNPVHEYTKSLLSCVPALKRNGAGQ